MLSCTKKSFILLTFCSTAFGAIIKNLGGTHADGAAVTNGWNNPIEGQKAALQFCKEQNYTWAFKALISSTSPVGHKSAKELIKTCFVTESGLCFLSQKACTWMRKCLVADAACKRPPTKAIMDEFARSKKMRHMLDGEEPEDAEFRGKVENFDSKDMDMWELVQGAWNAGVDSLRSVSASNMERLYGYGFVEEGLFFHVLESYDERSLKQAGEIAQKRSKLDKKEKLIDAVNDAKDRKQFLKGTTAGLFFTVACGSQYLQWGHLQDNSFYRWDDNGNSRLIEGGDWVC
jgi:hypothetical protein